MRRVLATVAVTAMMVFAPATAALAGGPHKGGNNNGDCTSRGANKGGTCNTTIIGDTDGDGLVRYECHNAAGGFIVVNVANCTSILFPTLVIIDL